MKSFVQSYRLTETDLTKSFYWGETGAGVTGLPIVDGMSAPWTVNPYFVSYEIDFIDPIGLYPIRVGPFNRVPLTTPANAYYANLTIGEKWATGNYQILWKSQMTGETGVPYVESTETFQVTTAGTYDVHGVTGPVIWNNCIYSVTGSIGYTGAAPTPGGETGTQPYPTIAFTYNAVSRYQVVDTAGQEVWITSDAPDYMGLMWARYGGILSISQRDHGMSVGDRIVLRNTNVDYQSTVVTATTVDSFSMPVANTGYTQGFNGHYSRGLNFSHVGSPKTGGVVTTSNNQVKLLSLRIRTGARASTTYAVQVPASVLNDDCTSLGDSFVPLMSVRQDADHLSATAATIAANQGGNYSNFLVANLGNPAASRIIILVFG